MCPTDWIQLISLRDKHFCLLSHLPGMYLLISERGFCYVVQAGLELLAIFQSQPSWRTLFATFLHVSEGP